ncbi:MAG: hypothetical protein GC199_09155 [Alphaproteobacteria bacterium]|nr:hypothetical protein [Alphaproteobacteria bacterium]
MAELADIGGADQALRLPPGSRDRIRVWLGRIGSVMLHGLIVAILIWPTALNEGGTGGTGWADEIEIRASRESSSGYEGVDGENESPLSAPRQGVATINVQVELVSEADLVPRPPGMPMKPSDLEMLTALKAPEAVRTRPRVFETGELTPAPANRTADETDVRAPDFHGNLSEGGSGMQQTEAGSDRGRDQYGRGIGHSDRSGRGDHLTGSQIRDTLSGFTIVGKEGSWDGSTSNNAATRIEHSWSVYYAPTGEAEARFAKPAAAVPHGDVSLRQYAERGNWRIEGDLLCQAIENVGYGAPVCFEMHRKGDQVALYYVSCGALFRCYPGRLGPEGVLVPGRAFTN